jgi:hypothetical protein
MKRKLFAGSSPLQFSHTPVEGRQVSLEGESFYQIANYDHMRPFLLSLVSSSDQWMFISSTGALTAGRGNPDQALFPYYTEDKIHDAAETTGGKTLLVIERRGKCSVWEPFSPRHAGIYKIHRNLYKNVWGNKLIFEECNEDLGLTFRYGWFYSDRFGFVRKAWLIEESGSEVGVHLLDGLQNLMPWGVGSQFQLEKSTLLDAYKRGELVPKTGLAIFRLSSVPVDRPEPAEALRATMVWSLGVAARRFLLSSVQVDRFRRGLPLRAETDVRGERGAYWLEAQRLLRAGGRMSWVVVADIGCGAPEVAVVRRLLRRPARLISLLEADVDRGTRDLQTLVASADGLQKTASPLRDSRHSNNVLSNIMRGGIFVDGYHIDPADLQAFVVHANRELAAKHSAFFRRLKPRTRYLELVQRAAASGDLQLERLCREYLPLTFSRRHGDPSRPWNRFSIAPRKADGRRMLDYEGNWRDIFQNWEALAVSFPSYVSGMICRFASASTADGYNPYRITRGGIDWEVVDPSDPWAHIGYWGDHQLIYLLKLLEILRSHDPDALVELLTRDLFAYANVPYRIRPYASLLKNPKETVDFVPETEALVQKRVQAKGSDGKLLWDERGRVRQVNLAEKLLVSLLAKLSSFVPEAGVWLNTQRPEWNDANNALVGNGVSMVTLYYLRRWLAFCLEVFAPLQQEHFEVSVEVDQFLAGISKVLVQHRQLIDRRLSDADRRRVLDALGQAGSRYREGLYEHGLCGRRDRIQGKRLLDFFSTSLAWVDHAIDANQRPDRLYHAYNLVQFDKPGALPIRRLYEMLEGQVAALSSGRLKPEDSVEVLVALRRSAMYRADQRSYLLYPNRELPRFTERNNIPASVIRRCGLLRALAAEGDCSLVERDVAGGYHFNGGITNAQHVKVALEKLAAQSKFGRLVRRDSPIVLGVFEGLFDHESFTGRSGTFFAYEGLGSIYWHMVSKLLLAVQETYLRSVEAGASAAVLRRLAEAYFDIRSGIGDHKTPGEYGAFPADPYSHTPAHTGARQPGLTGQVKEDILCRFGELGIAVREGRFRVRPLLLRTSEFIKEPATFSYYDVSSASRRLRLPAQSLAFTYCQVPFLYRLARESGLVVRHSDGSEHSSSDLVLDRSSTRSILERDGSVQRVTVFLAGVAS